LSHFLDSTVLKPVGMVQRRLCWYGNGSQLARKKMELRTSTENTLIIDLYSPNFSA